MLKKNSRSLNYAQKQLKSQNFKKKYSTVVVVALEFFSFSKLLNCREKGTFWKQWKRVLLFCKVRKLYGILLIYTLCPYIVYRVGLQKKKRKRIAHAVPRYGKNIWKPVSHVRERSIYKFFLEESSHNIFMHPCFNAKKIFFFFLRHNLYMLKIIWEKVVISVMR